MLKSCENFSLSEHMSTKYLSTEMIKYVIVSDLLGGGEDTMNQPWPAALASARRPLNAMLRTRFVSALVTPRSVDDYLEIVDPTWSVREVRARIVEVRHETTDIV